MSEPGPVQCGDVYITEPVEVGARVQIRRVARDNSWADIRVTDLRGASWTKRQPLRDGRLPYSVRNIADLISGGGVS